MYHSMAKAFIYYNASNPRGKHHCKLYALCENNNWALINFKFCHRSYNVNDDVDNDGDISDSKNEYEIEVEMNKHNNTKNKVNIKPFYLTAKNNNNNINKVLTLKEGKEKDMEIKKQEKLDAKKDANMPKTVKLVSSMCEMLRNSGCVVNMDNLYSSPEVFIDYDVWVFTLEVQFVRIEHIFLNLFNLVKLM